MHLDDATNSTPTEVNRALKSAFELIIGDVADPGREASNDQKKPHPKAVSIILDTVDILRRVSHEMFVSSPSHQRNKREIQEKDRPGRL